MQLRPQGMALTETLMALVILSGGALATLWLYQQALLAQRQLLWQATAMGIAEDLAERMKVNAAQSALYARDWGGLSARSDNDCTRTACSRITWATSDLQEIERQLRQLPQGDLAVYRTSPMGWGIAVAWRDLPSEPEKESLTTGPQCPSGLRCWRLLFQPDA